MGAIGRTIRNGKLKRARLSRAALGGGADALRLWMRKNIVITWGRNKDWDAKRFGTLNNKGLGHSFFSNRFCKRKMLNDCCLVAECVDCVVGWLAGWLVQLASLGHVLMESEVL